jgi:predicted signal transduction protein with EAL and GGDEF domain
MGLVRPGDTLARVSGDEFVFLCEDLDNPADVELLARRIESAFAHPFELSGLELSITASVGVAFAGSGDDISSQLVVEADAAMYEAKRKGGGGYQIIDLRPAFRNRDRDSLESDVRAAFDMKELDVVYQPIVRSEDGLVTGVEALVRRVQQRGALPASSLVALAEQSKLNSDIGDGVLERCCLDRRRWLDEHHGAPLDLAVNVSARQLLRRDFCGTVGRVLDRTGMDPTALVLEMTENVFIEDGERATAVLIELKRLGVRLALDDFGTGYSSLTYLLHLPVNIVKIDQSFIAGMGHNPAGEAIVAAVTDLAHALGLAVTAAGVETRTQRDQVRALGCEFSQGSYYARPMTATAIGAQLAAVPTGSLRLPTPINAAVAATR